MHIKQIKEGYTIDAGAPMPTILSNEHQIYLIFYVSMVNPDWNGPRINERTESDERFVTIKFDRYAQFKFGNPNDEAISGHPLYKFGLQPYSVQKVVESEWIKELTKMNSIHPYHNNEQFTKYQHFIFFFHDTCFEIVAEGYSIEQSEELTLKDEIQRVVKFL
ncbi:hypothetical protein LZ575_03230 [Antarcticibacterium sp. 1MA-6-2]|uniref:hypothetical protein n=1 Tax=Antarcticibacterium sp. 1MA-6-2 TaxID=2908210 RepID=UPI001F397DFB|nr:hypothetical protein [Antarcticibacterium sp. 1MA-6-2]UJH91712.1 hypothetical protein LZ575_03230 [Antarcticibacterium sp. 1MA-6-2]